MTVLFCDLVGFTALSDNADPEDVQSVLRPYYQTVRSELERYGGTVEKFIGDAVVGVFGVPVAHEDDAERAVRAGLSIVPAVSRLRTPWGVGLDVRVGIATGEALASLTSRPLEGEGIAAGDVVNTAARLQAAAGTGEIVVGAGTHRLTRNAIEYVELPPVRAKGKADPVEVWKVAGARYRPQSRVVRPAPPFVGREREKALLQAALSGVVQNRSAQLVTILGEPGVGKTRLVAELFDTVNAMPGRVTWRQGRCLPYGDGITFWALGEIVKAQAGILSTDDPVSSRKKLSRAVAGAVNDTGERAWIVATLWPLVGAATGEQGASREETFTGWRRFFEALAERQPLVLVVEDLHWADAALLDFLDHLRDRCTHVPLLLIGTARPEFAARAGAWSRDTPNSVTVPMSGLGGAERVELLRALLGTTVLPADTQELLLTRCGGNPLYAEELVRLLLESGERTAGGAGGASDADRALALPDTLHALIAARLDTLDQGDRDLLHDAAVVGSVFWSGAVATVGDRDESAVRIRLHELACRDFLRPVPTSSVDGQAEFAFWHELIRDVAYAQIPRGARAAKHEAVAGWLERTAGSRVADYAEILVHHYGRALELNAAAQSGPVVVLHHALRKFSVLAGDRAVPLDPTIAESYYRRALQLFPAEDPERPAVLNKAGWLAAAAGHADAAVAAYREAHTVSLVHGDRRAAGDAKHRLAHLYWDRGDTASARAEGEEAIALLNDAGPCVELAYALAFMAFDTWTSSRPDEALRWAEQLIAVADVIGGGEIRGLALMERGRARLDLDDPQGIEDEMAAVAATNAALERGNTAIQGSWQLLNWQSNLAEGLWLAEGTAAALAAGQEAQRMAVRRGLLHPLRAVRADGLKVLLDAGRWDELLREATEVSTSVESDEADYWWAVADANRAHVLLRRGQVASAAEIMVRALPQARSIGDLQVFGPALEVASLILLAQGELDEAADRVREFADRAQFVPSRRAVHLPAMVRVCAAVGELGLAQRLVEGTELRLRRHACAHRTARAIVAEAQGALDTALREYEEAAAGWQVYGHVLERGLALLGAGRCASRLGELRAVTSLQSARGVFAFLGARSLGMDADALLDRAAPAHT
ncbi:ATP-binding protein [Geodermatophilus sp. CPCC 205506]|uniref:ATP-binding protein n=1 Tax=Geodermatophilus sp. CPCC 205506 TaxID=2936596 RepID=UPI003EE9489B